MSSTDSSSKTSMWEKTKAASRDWAQKVGKPVNKMSNKLGAEAFWPTSLDQEADKAARILRSFCLDGFESEVGGGKHGTDKKKSKSRDHIPPEVLRDARGLAIFTVLRTGLHWSGAGGSGVLVARDRSGKNSASGWSPPSGILVHTLGWGLIAGADIYDCVCVLNTDDAVAGFQRARCSLGGEVSAAVGPLGAGSQLESDVLSHRAPVWTYIKSRGLYGGVQVDGSIIGERSSENERFYGVDNLRVQQILNGEVSPPAGSCVQLWETLQAAEGRPHDQNKLPPSDQSSPGDYQLNDPQANSDKDYTDTGAVTQSERLDTSS